MYLADTTVLSKNKNPEVHERMEQDLLLSKNLYNAALFRIRQVFTGWEKEERTQNEEEVFRELRTMQAAYPKVKVGRVLSYRALDAVMRANNNPDFFAGLPMQTAQRVLKEAVTVFRAWLSSLKEFRRAPERYTGRPCMPKYLKNDRHTFYITNQDAVLYPVYRKTDAAGRKSTDSGAPGEYDGMELKLPLMKKRLYLRHIAADSRLKEVQVKPYYGKILLVLVLETEDPPMRSLIWPGSTSERTTSQPSYRRTMRPVYTKAVLSFQRTGISIRGRRKRPGSSQKERSVSMRTVPASGGCPCITTAS